MTFKELAQTRYTTKKYDSDRKLNNGQIAELKQILNLSPSSINSQPWKFAFVGDAALKEQLSKVSYFNEPKVRDASHVVVFTVFDDISAFEQQIETNLPEGAVGYYRQFIKGLPEHEIKAWLSNQVYIALGFFLSACASMGIDATPMEGIEGEAYTEILGLKGYRALCAVCIGYRDLEDTNQPSVRPKSRLALDAVIQEF